jgi:hypothetical protein
MISIPPVWKDSLWTRFRPGSPGEKRVGFRSQVVPSLQDVQVDARVNRIRFLCMTYVADVLM